MMYVHILLLVCVCVCWIESYPNGMVEDACQNMTPAHSNVEPQTDSCPYQISVSSSTFTPGQTITITLHAAGNASEFQGFMLQAREVDGETAVGHFTSIDTNQSRPLNCFNIENSTLSQASANNKFKFEATWEALDSSLGDVHFLVTIVEDYTTFWTMVNSSIIRLIDNPSPSNVSSTNTSTTSPSTGSWETSSLPNSCPKSIHMMQLSLIILPLILHALQLSIDL